MKALMLHAAVSTLVLAGSIALSALQVAVGTGHLTDVQQLIVQTGVNVHMNALLWNLPTDQLNPEPIFGDLSFLDDTPLEALIHPSDSQQVSDPEVDQSNHLTAIQKAISFKAILHLEQTVLQTDLNFDSTGLFSEPSTGDLNPSLLFHDFDFLQSIPPLDLPDPNPGSKKPLTPFSLPGDPQEPTLLVSQTIIQTGVNFNLNILDILSDDPAPTSADEFAMYFPSVT
jgi:hypothetical protein